MAKRQQSMIYLSLRRSSLNKSHCWSPKWKLLFRKRNYCLKARNKLKRQNKRSKMHMLTSKRRNSSKKRRWTSMRRLRSSFKRSRRSIRIILMERRQRFSCWLRRKLDLRWSSKIAGKDWMKRPRSWKSLQGLRLSKKHSWMTSKRELICWIKKSLIERRRKLSLRYIFLNCKLFFVYLLWNFEYFRRRKGWWIRKWWLIWS